MYVPYMAMTARKKTFTLPHSNAHGRRERERPTKEAIRRKKKALLNVGPNLRTQTKNEAPLGEQLHVVGNIRENHGIPGKGDRN